MQNPDEPNKSTDNFYFCWRGGGLVRFIFLFLFDKKAYITYESADRNYMFLTY